MGSPLDDVPVPSVAVVVVRMLDARPVEVLLLERTPARGGGWQVVTGRIEPEDGVEDAAEQAARREVLEETGLVPHRVADLGLEAWFVGYDGRRYAERSFVAEVGAGEVRVSSEHTGAVWTSLGEALARLTWNENRRAVSTAISWVLRNPATAVAPADSAADGDSNYGNPAK